MKQYFVSKDGSKLVERLGGETGTLNEAYPAIPSFGEHLFGQEVILDYDFKIGYARKRWPFERPPYFERCTLEEYNAIKVQSDKSIIAIPLPAAEKKEPPTTTPQTQKEQLVEAIEGAICRHLGGTVLNAEEMLQVATKAAASIIKFIPTYTQDDLNAAYKAGAALGWVESHRYNEFMAGRISIRQDEAYPANKEQFLSSLPGEPMIPVNAVKEIIGKAFDELHYSNQPANGHSFQPYAKENLINKLLPSTTKEQSK